MEKYLNANFGGVKPKISPEEALRGCRLLRSLVNNPKRRFRFTANLSKRSEAEAMKKTNKEKLKEDHLVSMDNNPLIDDAGSSAQHQVSEEVEEAGHVTDASVVEESGHVIDASVDEESGHVIDGSEKSLERRHNLVMTLMILAVCAFIFLAVAFAFLAAGISAKGWPKGNIGWEKSVEELEKYSHEVITRIDDTLHVIEDLDASRKDHQREIAGLKEQSDVSRKDHQRNFASLKEQLDASRKDLQHDITSLREQLKELSSRIGNSQVKPDNIRIIQYLLNQIIQECRESNVIEWKASTRLEEIAEGVINFIIGAYHGVKGTRIKGEVMIAHRAYEWVSSYWNSDKKVGKEEQKCSIQLQQLEKILDLF